MTGSQSSAISKEQWLEVLLVASRKALLFFMVIHSIFLAIVMGTSQYLPVVMRGTNQGAQTYKNIINRA